MEKTKLSSKQVEETRNVIAEVLRAGYNQLQGRLLTTLDSAMESDRQVEGLKARVKDIQGLMWDEIYCRKEEYLGDSFVSGVGEVDDLSMVKRTMVDFVCRINDMILDEFNGFRFRVKNLIGMVFTGGKFKCVFEEIDRIISKSSGNLQRYIARGLNIKLERKPDSGDEG